jgi:hypothetical protein
LTSYTYAASTITFVFRTKYGLSADYEAMQCYEWVFSFDVSAEYGTTVYTVPTHIETGEENVAMGMAFLAIGQLDAVLDDLTYGTGVFVYEPQLEPACLQSAVNTFIERINIANEPRPCPTACPCPSSSDSVESSSSSSSSSECVNPTPTEPAAAYAPTRLPLPGGLLTGDILIKPGYNCTLDVIKSAAILTVSAGLGRGEGVVCEDLRTDDAGNLIAETCVGCGGLVYAINDTGYDVEELQLVGGRGIVIEPDAANHTVYVRIDEEGICEVDV